MRIAIIGRSEILYDTAKLLVNNGHEIVLIITAKAAPEYMRTENDFSLLAKELGCYYLCTNKLSDFKVMNKVKILNIDIGISMNFINIISQEFIDLFKYGILNAHTGDLPRYKGNACQAWAIINGEKKIGLCIHKMIGGILDDGDIIEREYLPISIKTKVGDCWRWMHEETPKLFNSAIKKIHKNSEYYLVKQGKTSVRSMRCYPRIPEDGRINWNDKVINIIRLINASNKPYYGAYCFYQDEEIRIWDANIVEVDFDFFAIPGQVCEIAKKHIHVACNDGMLQINWVSFRNQEQFPSDFIRSIRARLY